MSNIPAALAYGKRTIRMVVMNGIPKFSATDICNILGYVNPNKTLGRFCESSPEYIKMQTTAVRRTCVSLPPMTSVTFSGTVAAVMFRS